MTGVESANPFDLLGDESAPAPVAPVAAAKTSKAPASKAPASAPKQQQQQRSAPRNNVVSNAPPLSTAPKEAHSFEKKHAPKKPAHGRAFDRKSGTGRRDDGVKKNAVGKGNWGETVDGQLGADEVAAAEVAAVELDPEAEAAAAAAAAQAAEEAKYQTLDAFLANKTSAKWTEVQPRKANEGVDEKKWKDAKQLVKEEDEVIIVGKKPSKASAPAPVTTPKENNKKVFLDIEQKFAEPAGSGFTPKDDRERKGGRKPFGDRNSSSNNNNTAGPKGGANSNKGGPRGPSGPKTTLNVADNVAFPSLGSK